MFISMEYGLLLASRVLLGGFVLNIQVKVMSMGLKCSVLFMN